MATRSSARLRREKMSDRSPTYDREPLSPIKDVTEIRGSVVSEKTVVKTDLAKPGSQCESKRSTTTARSHRSQRSSIAARRAQIELAAAQEKARIKMELIDKKMAADVAALEDEREIYSSQSRSEKSALSERHSTNNVERWLDTQRELEGQRVQRTDYPEDAGLLPVAPACAPGTDGPVQQLAAAIQQLASTNQNANLLSRISTPRDLPIFSGEPMEWLQFLQAYQESTELCKFNEKENLWRLRRCLRGPARDAVSALLVTSTSPDTVMSTLKLQFGNPDIILNKIVTDIKKLGPLSLEYHKDIIKFSIRINNFVAAVRALERDEYLQGNGIATLVLGKLPTVLISKWIDYYASKNQEASSKCRLVTLAEFLNEEAVKLSQSGAQLLYLRQDTFKRQYNHSEPPLHTQTVLLQNKERVSNKCSFCRVSVHKLTECKKFKKSLRKDRWWYVRRNRICFKCLVATHDKQTCPAAACDVENCGQDHHRLLHYVPRQNPPSMSPNESAPEPQTETVNNVNASGCVLLKTVPIKIHGPNGVFNTVALLDDGSTVTLISAALTQRAGLHGRKDAMRVRGAWDGAELSCETQVIKMTVSNKIGARFDINARSVVDLKLPKQNLKCVNCDSYNHLSSVKSDLFVGQCKPEVLIGQDNYHLMLPLESLVGSPREPCATRTPLGWCLHGRVPGSVHAGLPSRPYTTLFVSSDDHPGLLRNLHNEVRHFFSFESMGVSAKPRQNSEDLRALDVLERTSTLKDGQWHVSLPWKDPNGVMPNSLPNAMSRLESVEQKMGKNTEFAQRYKERVKHLFDNDYAKQLSDDDINTCKSRRIWYLPHFGVDNPNKKKLRLVFDAAARVNGLSLNDYLLKGPDLLQSLFGIMLRFRENEVAVTGDIKDMFLRVKINSEDQHALRFLFRAPGSETRTVNTYVMTSLIFGANCSPFIAQFVKNKNAERFKEISPDAYEAITKSHYMDDYIDSLPNENTAVQLVADVTRIHSLGNFEIRNWTSNSKAVLDTIPKDALGEAAVRFKAGQQEQDGERTLGLLWHPSEDALRVDLSLKRIPVSFMNGEQRPTKRQILKIVMSIFDVYGLFSPITIIGKIILQECWLTSISWDEDIPTEIFVKWNNWIKLLESLRQVRLPRYYHNACARVSETEHTPLPISASYTNLQLHTFCDASTKAICAVAYWRWSDSRGKIRVAFIASKCRVAPVKPTTVPRLELQAAVLAARLADTIVKEHRIKPQQRFFWSDSTTVLQWIGNNTRNYSSYIANRLGEIDELSDVNEWRYVPTKRNVADVATRENCEVAALDGEWLHGPTFLGVGEDEWPTNVTQHAVNKTDLECNTLLLTSSNELCIPEPERFSSWLRLVRTMFVILKFINKTRKGTIDDHTLMEKAERILICHSQAQSFGDELVKIRMGEHLPKNSKLLALTPFLDDAGVLRVAGRIDAAFAVAPEVKRPAILDGSHYITRLIVRAYHIQTAHGNQETVVNQLKQRYWVLRLRPTVKSVAAKCMSCRIKKCQPEIPRMGDLPEARMAHHHRPFTFCGVDLFGPIEVTVGRRREKRYGVLFTCLTARAIHIEVVPSLTTDSLIMALRRMAARRAWPQRMFSDNGTNLRGADAELKRSILQLDEDALKNETMNRGTKWTFIPPASPHWGGAWERLIRSVKTSLKVVLKERAPREETFVTFLAEVENIVNSRPLVHVSVDPRSPETLTPNHFLIGSSSNLPRLGVFDDTEIYLRKQWRISQRLADLYWQRWVREVLPEMLPRRKWNEDQRGLQVGDVALIADPNNPRNVWPRGIVEEVVPGKDGRVRMARVRTGSGVLTRSVTRVVRIPIVDECC